MSSSSTEADHIRSIGANHQVKCLLTAALSEIIGLPRLAAGLELTIKFPANPGCDLGKLPDLVVEMGQQNRVSPHGG